MRGMSARPYGHQGARCDSDGNVYGVQAPLQMSTAACARQGRMGRDQVRAKVDFEALAPSSDVSPLRFTEFSITAYCVLHSHEDMIIAHRIMTGESSSNSAFTIAVASFVLHMLSMEMLC
jgi:hypothetical protein